MNRVFVLYLVFVLVFTILLVWLAGLWLGCCCSRIDEAFCALWD
jgi:hypothetical protein